MLALGVLSGLLERSKARLAEHLLGYWVGTRVEVAEAAICHVDWQGNWRVRLKGVRLQSTLPKDTTWAAWSEEVRIEGRGRRPHTIRLRKAVIHLLRLSRTAKNYHFFPKRGKGAHAHTLTLLSDSLAFAFWNLPSQAEIQAYFTKAEATLTIYPTSIALNSLKANIAKSEICFKDYLLCLPNRLELLAKGLYRKAEDSWDTLHLTLQSSGSWLAFFGCWERWTYPFGRFAAALDPRLLEGQASFLKYVTSNPLSLAGQWQGKRYVLYSRGNWTEGTYHFQVRGHLEGKPYLRGAISWGPWLRGRLWGTPARLYLSGSLRYPPLQGALHSILYPAQARGQLFLADPALSLEAEGSLTHATLKGLWEGIAFTGRLTSAKGLELTLPALAWDTLQPKLAAYQSLFSLRQTKWSLPFSLFLTRLEFPFMGTLESLCLRFSGGRGEAEANLCATETLVTGKLRAIFTLRPLQGSASLLGEHLQAALCWHSDTLRLTAKGVWREISGLLIGRATLSEKYLYLDSLCLTAPDSSLLTAQGKLSLTQADLNLQAEVALPWVLGHLPIPGVKVEKGRLAMNFCALGAWADLLRLSNPTEGSAHLWDAGGLFPGLGLPFDHLSAYLTYTPDSTYLHRLTGQVGSLRLTSTAKINGALAYLYTNWHQLQGKLYLEGDTFRLTEFWRRVENGRTRRQVRLPTQMAVEVQAQLRHADIFGLTLDTIHLHGRLDNLWAVIDSVRLHYHGGSTWGQGWADLQDSTCYLLTARIEGRDLPIHHLLEETGLGRLRAVKRLGLYHSDFSGTLQLSLRFTPEVSWHKQSSLWGRGTIENGSLRTPRFLRWLRPYYLRAYKDTLRFLAEVPKLNYTDGFLHLHDLLLITPIGALQVEGYHHLPRDRFLYRIQGVRFPREIQRHPLTLYHFRHYLMDFLDHSLLLLYLERTSEQTRWHYPLKYVLRQLIWPKKSVRTQ
ncbi:MAG: hypothetical protein RMJ49_05310 [Bacteroidia bacterium]|nr:hypothetical protein [Bacteroidia bacterium]